MWRDVTVFAITRFSYRKLSQLCGQVLIQIRYETRCLLNVIDLRDASNLVTIQLKWLFSIVYSRSPFRFSWSSWVLRIHINNIRVINGYWAWTDILKVFLSQSFAGTIEDLFNAFLKRSHTKRKKKRKTVNNRS